MLILLKSNFHSCDKFLDMTTFPADMPAQCPPGDAQVASGQVFRIVRRRTLTSDDFLTHDELGKLPDADPCLRRGISVFPHMKGAVHQARLLPRLGSFIACGSFKAHHGLIKRTNGRAPDHTTWWPYQGVNRLEPFDNVVEIPAVQP